MSNLTVIGTDAASLAAQLIEEWPSWPKSALRRELAQFQELASQVPPSSSLEAERIEVFLGATDSLDSDRPERVQAALYLLEHLASAEQASR